MEELLPCSLWWSGSLSTYLWCCWFVVFLYLLMYDVTDYVYSSRMWKLTSWMRAGWGEGWRLAGWGEGWRLLGQDARVLIKSSAHPGNNISNQGFEDIAWHANGRAASLFSQPDVFFTHFEDTEGYKSHTFPPKMIHLLGPVLARSFGHGWCVQGNRRMQTLEADRDNSVNDQLMIQISLQAETGRLTSKQVQAQIGR